MASVMIIYFSISIHCYSIPVAVIIVVSVTIRSRLSVTKGAEEECEAK